VKRNLFFDKQTGEILHSHQTYAFGSEELIEPDDESLALILERLQAPASLARLVTEEEPVSSFRAGRRVDVRTGVLQLTEADPRYRRKSAESEPPSRGGR
jgi:hypothetical protein